MLTGERMSITPVRYDFTAYAAIDLLKGWDLQL
jgi:hypothetical protein